MGDPTIDRLFELLERTLDKFNSYTDAAAKHRSEIDARVRVLEAKVAAHETEIRALIESSVQMRESVVEMRHLRVSFDALREELVAERRAREKTAARLEQQRISARRAIALGLIATIGSVATAVITALSGSDPEPAPSPEPTHQLPAEGR